MAERASVLFSLCVYPNSDSTQASKRPTPSLRSAWCAVDARRVSIQQSPKIYGGKELSNYNKRLLSAGRRSAWCAVDARRVSIQQSPKIYGGKELSNYNKRLLLAGR